MITQKHTDKPLPPRETIYCWAMAQDYADVKDKLLLNITAQDDKGKSEG